ncbi:MAG: hypothetical protein KGI42_07275 [Xanthomonadaceae bacterium]|nr:hypothetical protein [Xanthomonadaceae bacterium]
MDEIAFSERKRVKKPANKAQNSSEKSRAGIDPRDYPDVYLTNWYGVSYAAICFTKNMEGTLNFIILIAMGKFGLRDIDDIKAWINGHLEEREDGMPPSMNVAPIPGFEKMPGGEAMQALGTALAFWIDAAILRQRGTTHIGWPSLMQAQLHLGRAMGPVPARELVSKAAAAKEKVELKTAVLDTLIEMPDKSTPTLYITFMKVMTSNRVKKIQYKEKMDSEKLYGYLEYSRKRIIELRSEFIRVTNKTSRGAPSVEQRNMQEIMLSEIMNSEPGVYEVVRKKIDKHKRKI